MWALLLAFLMPEILLHAKQEKALMSDKRIIVCCSGIQGGKTKNGAVWMRQRVSMKTDSNVNFLVTAPTVKIFNQATEPAFLEYFQGMGQYNKSEHVFEMNRKRKVFLRSLHEPDAIEGMTNVEGIWADEAGKYSSKAWVNIEGRSAFRQCPIFVTTTPYALNWLWKDLYKPWTQGKRNDVEFVQWASVENPFFPKEEYERQKRLLDPRVFAMKYEGKFERMAGLVYPDIHDVDNYEKPFAPHPRDYLLVGGIDFGFQNPFAVSLWAIHRKNPVVFQIGEFYKSGLLLDDITAMLRKMHTQLGIEHFYADSEEPRTIADLQARGIPVHPVKKGPDSVKNGIAILGEMYRTRELRMFTGKCSHTEDELATYHYPEDIGEERNQEEVPVKANDHLCDANRYLAMMTKEFRRNREEARIPKLAKDDLEDLLSGDWAKRVLGKDPDGDWYNEGG